MKRYEALSSALSSVIKRVMKRVIKLGALSRRYQVRYEADA
jgi:hypothetical protein